MPDSRHLRPVHPCISRRCGHAADAHLHTPELEAPGETVLWCAECRRHEVRAPRRFWGARPERRPPSIALGRAN